MIERRHLLLAAGAAGLAGVAGVAGGVLLRGRSDQPLEPGELTILSGRDESLGRQRHRLVDQWWEAMPNHRPRIIEVGGVADAHRSELVAMAQSEEPVVDIYNLDVTWTAEFADAGYLRPLDRSDLDTDGFLEQPRQTCEHDGELWALPFNTDAGLLYYRSGLVDENEVPSDWGGIEDKVGDLLDAQEEASSELVAGYAGQFADYEGFTVNLLEMIWAEGGEVMVGEWHDPAIEVESDEVARALRRLVPLFTGAEQPLFLPDSVGYDEPDTTQAFREGKVVFMRNWPVAYRSLRAPEGEGAETAAAYDVRRLPGPSVLGGQNLAIARGTPRPRAAQALIEFLTGEDAQLQLFRDGGLPATRRAVYDNSEVTRRHPYAQVLREAIEDARERPRTPYYARFSEVFRRGMRQALLDGGELPEGFADRLAAALGGVLQ